MKTLIYKGIKYKAKLRVTKNLTSVTLIPVKNASTTEPIYCGSLVYYRLVAYNKEANKAYKAWETLKYLDLITADQSEQILSKIKQEYGKYLDL